MTCQLSFFPLKSHQEGLEELAVNLISFMNYLPNPEGKAKGHKGQNETLAQNHIPGPK